MEKDSEDKFKIKMRSENKLRTDKSLRNIKKRKRDNNMSKGSSDLDRRSSPNINTLNQSSKVNLDDKDIEETGMFPLNKDWEVKSLSNGMTDTTLEKIQPCSTNENDADLRNGNCVVDNLFNGKASCDDRNKLTGLKDSSSSSNSVCSRLEQVIVDRKYADSYTTDFKYSDNDDDNSNSLKMEMNGNNQSSDGDLDTSTDFSRFKEYSFCDELFPPDVWKSIEEGDLETLSRHVESTMDNSSKKFASRRKSTAHDSSSTLKKKRNIKEGNDESIGTIECKKIKMEGDKSASCVASCSKSHDMESTAKKVNCLGVLPQLKNECYVALDCEMVGTGPKGSHSVLGRCSIVDYDGTIVYDKFVRCLEPITDFRTRWSGIRPRDMKTAEPPVKAIQDIHKCLKNKIVIGHSVRNDFNVVYFHPHRYLVRDTLTCAALSRKANLGGSKQGMGLKTLTKNIFGKDIQTGKKGHDSTEDARATLELFKVVREEWEKQLFSNWKKEGLNVEKFITNLNNKIDVEDTKGKVITDFQNKSEVSESQICDLLADNSKVKGCNSSNDSNDNDLDYDFNVDFLSDQYWPSAL